MAKPVCLLAVFNGRADLLLGDDYRLTVVKHVHKAVSLVVSATPFLLEAPFDQVQAARGVVDRDVANVSARTRLRRSLCPLGRHLRSRRTIPYGRNRPKGASFPHGLPLPDTLCFLLLGHLLQEIASGGDKILAKGVPGALVGRSIECLPELLDAPRLPGRPSYVAKACQHE
jgi:hypothetical protein